MKLLRIFSIMLGLGLAFYGFYGIGSRTGLFKHNRTPEQVNAEVKKQGLKVLEKKEAADPDVALALIRLGSIGQVEARNEALKRLNSKSPAVRRATALALARFSDPEVIAAYRILLKDPEDQVRMAAIQSLGVTPAYEKEPLLSEIANRKGISNTEKIAALASYLKIAATTATQERIMEDLLKLYPKAETDEIAADIISAMAPRGTGNPKFIDLLRAQFKNTHKPKLSLMALRYLTFSGDPWVRVNMKEFLSVKNSEYRTAAIEMIPVACPFDRFEVLERALVGFEEDARFMEILKQTLERMPGEGAKMFMEKMASDKKLLSRDQEWARKLAPEIMKSPVVDKCEFIDAREEGKK